MLPKARTHAARTVIRPSLWSSEISGCTARFCGNYWKVERRNPDQPRDVHLRPGQKWRTQTGVTVNASYEDWRRELNAFVGGLGS